MGHFFGALSKICLGPNFAEHATVHVAIQRIIYPYPLLPSSKSTIIMFDGTVPHFCRDANHFKFPWLGVQTHKQLFEGLSRSSALVSLGPHML